MAFTPNTPYGKWIGRLLFIMHAPWFDEEVIQAIIAYLQSCGNHSGGANEQTHWRISLDGKMICLHSAWAEEELDIEWHIPRIAEASGKNEDAIRAQLELIIFAPGSSVAAGDEFARQFYANNTDDWESES